MEMNNGMVAEEFPLSILFSSLHLFSSQVQRKYSIVAKECLLPMVETVFVESTQQAHYSEENWQKREERESRRVQNLEHTMTGKNTQFVPLVLLIPSPSVVTVAQAVSPKQQAYRKERTLPLPGRRICPACFLPLFAPSPCLLPPGKAGVQKAGGGGEQGGVIEEREENRNVFKQNRGMVEERRDRGHFLCRLHSGRRTASMPESLSQPPFCLHPSRGSCL